MITAIKKWFVRSDPSPTYTLAQLADLDWIGGKPSASGVRIDAAKALSIPAFRRGVDLVSGKIAGLSCKVYRTLPDGSREIYREHPAYLLLDKRFSPWISAKTGLKALYASALIYGNGYGRIRRNQLGDPLRIDLLDAATTYTDYDASGRLIYVTHSNGTERVHLASDIIHIRGLSLDGLNGVNTLDSMRDTFGLSIAELVYASKYFANNGGLNKYISIPGTITNKELQKEFVDSVKSLGKSLDNAHSIVGLQHGAEIKTVGSSARDAELIEARRHGLVDQALIAGCPPSRLGADTNTSYGSLEADELAFINDLENWLMLGEDEFGLKLLSTAEYDSGDVYIEFDRMGNNRNNPDGVISRLQTQITSGQVTLNEARKIQNMPALDHEYADIAQPLWAVLQAEKAMEQAQAQAEQESEQAQAQAEQESEPEPKPESDQRLLNLTSDVISRWFKRLAKASESGTFEISDHSEILVESLRAVADPAKAGEIVTALQEELAALSRRDYNKALTYNADHAHIWAKRVL